jgi:hypothetical protein
MLRGASGSRELHPGLACRPFYCFIDRARDASLLRSNPTLVFASYGVIQETKAARNGKPFWLCFGLQNFRMEIQA